MSRSAIHGFAVHHDVKMHNLDLTAFTDLSSDPGSQCACPLTALIKSELNNLTVFLRLRGARNIEAVSFQSVGNRSRFDK
jgi:hypothetical protein